MWHLLPQQCMSNHPGLRKLYMIVMPFGRVVTIRMEMTPLWSSNTSKPWKEVLSVERDVTRWEISFLKEVLIMMATLISSSNTSDNTPSITKDILMAKRSRVNGRSVVTLAHLRSREWRRNGRVTTHRVVSILKWELITSTSIKVSLKEAV